MSRRRSVKSVTRDSATFVEERSLLDLILQLPEDAAIDGFVDLEDQAPRTIGSESSISEWRCRGME